MRPLFIILPAAAFVGIAALLLLRGAAPWQEPASAVSSSKTGPRPLPGSAESTRHATPPDGGLRLDAKVEAAVTELETAFEDFVAESKTRNRFEFGEPDWTTYAREKLSHYDLEVIRALARAIADPEIQSRIGQLEGALFYVWGKSEPEAARMEIIRSFDALPDKKEGLEGNNVALDSLHKDFHEISAAEATRNPEAAWLSFLKYKDDPALNELVNSGVMLPEIFSSYAARSPELAWSLILEQTDAWLAASMLEGYLKGSGKGEDWRTRTAELLSTSQGRELESNRVYRDVCSRWLADSPLEALEWLSRNVTTAPDKSAGAGGISSSGEVAAPPSTIKAGVLADTYQSEPQGAEGATGAIASLLQRNEGDDLKTASDALSAIAKESLWRRDVVSLLPSIPDPETRAAVFLDFARSIPAKEWELRGKGWNEDPELQGLLDIQRKLALPPDLAASVEATLDELQKPAEKESEPPWDE